MKYGDRLRLRYSQKRRQYQLAKQEVLEGRKRRIAESSQQANVSAETTPLILERIHYGHNSGLFSAPDLDTASPQAIADHLAILLQDLPDVKTITAYTNQRNLRNELNRQGLGPKRERDYRRKRMHGSVKRLRRLIASAQEAGDALVAAATSDEEKIAAQIQKQRFVADAQEQALSEFSNNTAIRKYPRNKDFGYDNGKRTDFPECESPTLAEVNFETPHRDSAELLIKKLLQYTARLSQHSVDFFEEFNIFAAKRQIETMVNNYRRGSPIPALFSLLVEDVVDYEMYKKLISPEITFNDFFLWCASVNFGPVIVQTQPFSTAIFMNNAYFNDAAILTPQARFLGSIDSGCHTQSTTGVKQIGRQGKTLRIFLQNQMHFDLFTTAALNLSAATNIRERIIACQNPLTQSTLSL